MHFISIILALITGNIVVAQNTPPRNRHALLVGVSNYKEFAETNHIDQNHPWTNINGVNDVEMLHEDLKGMDFSIVMLRDREATYTNITHKLTEIEHTAAKGDMVYIHFSTHGQPFEDTDGDEDDGWDESIVPYDALQEYKDGVYEGEKHLTDDKLEKYVDAIREKVGIDGMVYVVIDACHAGNMRRGETDDTARGTKRGFSPSNKHYSTIDNNKTRRFIKKAPSTNIADVIYLEACQPHEVNKEIKEDGTKYGPLSYYIHKVMTDKGFEFDKNHKWIDEIKSRMNRDRRLANQNMMIESDIKNVD